LSSFNLFKVISPFLFAKITMNASRGNTNVATIEHQTIMEQAHHVTNQSRDSSKRMVGILVETEAVGVSTIEELTRQGEQLDRIEGNLDDMNYNIQKDAFDEKRVAKREKADWKAVAGNPGGDFVDKVLGVEAEDEMNDNLKQVSEGLGRLKGMALDMGNVIDYQNIQIEHRIQPKAEAMEVGLARNQHRLDQMLK